MTISFLGTVAAATAYSQTGLVSVPVTVDVPASNPTTGATLLFAFACVGVDPSGTPGVFDSYDSAAPSGIYASCGPNVWGHIDFGGYGGAFSTSGGFFQGLIITPLVAGTDTISLNFAGLGSPYDVTVQVLGWTGVGVTAETPPTSNWTGGDLQDNDTGNHAQFLRWLNTGPTNGWGPQADFPQGDAHNEVIIGRGVAGSHFPPIDWQFNICDVAVYLATTPDHGASFSETSLTWYDGAISEIASEFDFYSPLADTGGGSAPYSSFVVAQTVSPSLGTPGDFGITWGVSGSLGSNDIVSGGEMLCFVAGPGPLTCGGGLHIWQRI